MHGDPAMRGRTERLPWSQLKRQCSVRQLLLLSDCRANLSASSHRATFAHKSSTAYAPLLAAPALGGIRQAESCTKIHPTLMSLQTLEATPGSKARQARQGKARQGRKEVRRARQQGKHACGSIFNVAKKVPKKPQKVVTKKKRLPLLSLGQAKIFAELVPPGISLQETNSKPARHHWMSV